MPRVKRGVTAKARHKKVLKAAKGYYGARSRSFRVANQAVTKAGQYAYRDRKVRKREFRALWIQRIGAAAKENGLSYSRFIHGLKEAGVELDRKVLADLAVHDAAAFGQLAEQAKASL
ncbi:MULTISPECIES: 50S ribosomal protein L20 [Abyssibacter]|uniref:Large ribosomal subunit protein bL20 n=1 Tax=Abyssibacter profundi TaxID=2182787 RepID=A0A363UMU1_9GAMM|nr:50S ribosomal protein L20 [Abyssibacter profundi]MBV61729.1 50S ribosomal protein L20 [Nevskiales bacterium]MEC9407783.1 50S ribosomal protein L20 [Pseudomonadota bacterium]PWN56739.1 50S ribosomal protein L20 [Abyssibacter profundi]